MKKILLSIISLLSISFVNAQFDQAFHSNASTNSTVKIPTPSGSALLFSGSYTIEAWVHIIQVTNGSTPQYQIVESYGGTTGGYALRHESGYYKFYKLNGSANDVVSSAFHNAATNPTNHVTATYNVTTNEMKIYVDGVLEGTTTTSITTPVLQNNMYIGALGDIAAVQRDTEIDEVRIWDIAKTQTQIQNDMNTCLSGTETNLIAHYTFDNSNTSAVIDNTAGANNGSIVSFNASTSYVTGFLSCCTVNIPDANFKTYLVGNTAINTNGDSEIQCSEASAFTGQINVWNSSISDMTGLEAFTNLTWLNCAGNSFSILDVTSNINLAHLACGVNWNLYALDVSQNTLLTYLFCGQSGIQALDVSNNTLLDELLCNSSQIAILDVSQNTLLTKLNCSTNILTNLNVANGNNINFTVFDATNNPNLTCITVDDANWSTTNWTAPAYIDAAASFSLNCNSATGINEIATQNISIYPNPVSNQLNIEFSISTSLNEQIQRISILNITGKTVKTIASNNNTIDVSDLTKGIYFLQVQTDKGIANSKFIKE